VRRVSFFSFSLQIRLRRVVMTLMLAPRAGGYGARPACRAHGRAYAARAARYADVSPRCGDGAERGRYQRLVWAGRGVLLNDGLVLEAGFLLLLEMMARSGGVARVSAWYS
jgi:hypothetical protein